jgi:hypothetical protein
MINSSGSVTINGITDTELAEILEIKAKHVGQSQVFSFNPQALRQGNINTAQGVQSFYTDAQFNFTGDQGLKIIQEIVNFLLTENEKAKAQGQ